MIEENKMSLWKVCYTDIDTGDYDCELVIADTSLDAITLTTTKVANNWGSTFDEAEEGMDNIEAYPLHEVDGYKIIVEAKK